MKRYMVMQRCFTFTVYYFSRDSDTWFVHLVPAQCHAEVFFFFFFFFFNDLLKAEDLSLVGNLLWDHSCRCGTVLTCLYTFTFMYIESHWQCLLEVVLKQRKQLWSINNNSGLRRMTKLFSLQKTLNVTESNYQPSTTKSTMEPCP